MNLDLSAVGRQAPASTFEYDWKTVVLYALGIGATADDLDYLYEGRGPHVYPTFGVVPAFEPVWKVLAEIGANFEELVHQAQSLVLHRTLPPQGRLLTRVSVEGIYDFRRFAQINLRATSELDGERVCETGWSLVTRGQGGFGGPRPPKTRWPTRPDGVGPDFQVEARTSREQALLYRLSGDVNPLHVDPEFAARAGFAEGPILHGLCTFGYIGRAVVAMACGGSASRLKALHAQFRKPVWPGDSLLTEGYAVGSGNGTIALEVTAGGRPEPVVNNCWAEIAS